MRHAFAACLETLSSGLQTPPHRPLHWRPKRPHRQDHPIAPHDQLTRLALGASSCSFWACWTRALMRFTAPASEKMKKMFTTESHEIAMAAATISALSPSPAQPAHSPRGGPRGHRTPRLPPSRLAPAFTALLNSCSQPWRLHRCKGDLQTVFERPGPTERHPSHPRQTSKVVNQPPLSPWPLAAHVTQG